MNPAWRTFSRPQDNGHEYVAERKDRPGELYTRNGCVFVFDLEQVRRIEEGMEPAEAALLVAVTPEITTPPVPPAHAGFTEPAEPARKKPGRKPKNASSGHNDS